MKILLLLFSCIILASAQTLTEERQRLVRSIFRGYDKTVLPRRDEDAVTVYFGVALIAVTDIVYHEYTADVTVLTWRSTLWHDSRLTWNPADFSQGNKSVSVLRVPSDDVWKPDIELFNSMADHAHDSQYNAVVYSTGQVLHIPRQVEHITCDRAGGVDNKQLKCSMRFGSWSFDGYNVDLALYEGGTNIDVADFILQEFAVEGTGARVNRKYYPCCDEPYPYISFDFTLVPRSDVTGDVIAEMIDRSMKLRFPGT